MRLLENRSELPLIMIPMFIGSIQRISKFMIRAIKAHLIVSWWTILAISSSTRATRTEQRKSSTVKKSWMAWCHKVWPWLFQDISKIWNTLNRCIGGTRETLKRILYYLLSQWNMLWWQVGSSKTICLIYWICLLYTRLVISSRSIAKRPLFTCKMHLRYHSRISIPWTWPED
jgi:hypothetical protein